MPNLQSNMAQLGKITFFVLGVLSIAGAAEVESIPVPSYIAQEVGEHSFGWIMEKDYKKIQDTLAAGREIYEHLNALVEQDIRVARIAADGLRDNTIGALALAESMFRELPSIDIIRKMDRSSMAYKYVRAIGSLRSESSALASLVRQITHVSSPHESDIDPEALTALANHGVKVSRLWV